MHVKYENFKLIPLPFPQCCKKEKNDKETQIMFKVGDPVSKVGGDYKFDGIVVSVFTKLSGLTRLVVEDDRGILHVYSEKNLKLRVINDNTT